MDAHIAATFRTAIVERIDEARDGELKVCSLNASVRSMFELTRLNRVIPIAY